MKKKIANGIEVLFLIASYIIMKIPCVDILVETTLNENGEAFSYVTTFSAMDCIDKFVIMRNPMLVLFILCLIMCFISIFTKSEHRDGRIHSILAVILFVYTNYCIIACGGACGETVSTDFPVALFEICLFMVVVMSFVKRSTLIAGVPEVKISGNIMSNADELKKFKDLLDSGVITQEEFDEKKKQLLK